MSKNKKKALGLSTTIFISLIAGALFGILLHYAIPESDFKTNVIIEGVLYVCGQGFIRLMQMLVVPLVFCSLVCGSMAIGDTKTLGKVGVKTLLFYIATTAVAVSIALLTAYVIDPGLGLDMEAIQVAEVSQAAASPTIADTLLNIIPKNPINAMANGDMLPIIVFALFVGVMLVKVLYDVSHLTRNIDETTTIVNTARIVVTVVTMFLIITLLTLILTS